MLKIRCMLLAMSKEYIYIKLKIINTRNFKVLKDYHSFPKTMQLSILF